MLDEESRRSEGPRGWGDKAAIDIEIENFLARKLRKILPVHFVGEETHPRLDSETPYCWLVDPHDGTGAYLEGYRGTAVSVALLRDCIPVLGVVCAPMSPDQGWDLIAWAEGLPHLLRNGVEVHFDLSSQELQVGQIVYLNHRAAMIPVASGKRVAPARFVSLPSIAYRLARVAAGDGLAAVSTNAPCGLDYAAGHALLRGSGGVLLDEEGRNVSYDQYGTSAVSCCFGGAPKVARALATRSWSSTRQETQTRRLVSLSWPQTVIHDEVDRAKGCLFGQVVGDNLGALVEFKHEDQIAQQYRDGPRDLVDGGIWNILSGQATDDSELALALARSLLTRGFHDQEAIASAYGDWYASNPFDIGITTGRALSAANQAIAGRKAEGALSQADPCTPSNGSLMRVSPIGVWARLPVVADRFARRDSQLTHPNPVCVDACGVFSAAIAEGIRTGDVHAMLRIARKHARTEAVNDVLHRAEQGETPQDYFTKMGWVLIALQNAFFCLLHHKTFEEALVQTVRKGGDTDTNGAISGALLGAAWGLSQIPPKWVRPVM